MQKQTRIKIAIAAGVVALVVGAIIFFSYSHSPIRDKMAGLLRLKKIELKGDTVGNREMLSKYYDQFGYQQFWTQGERSNVVYRNMLLEMLNYADSLGLDPKDYHQDFVQQYDSLSKLPGFDFAHYQTESELIFTDATLSFLFNVAYGKDISIEYNGVDYNIDTARIVNEFNQLLVHRNWRQTLGRIEPRITQYVKLKKQLNGMRAFIRDFPEVDTLTVNNSVGGNLVAATKLSFYGFIADSVANDSSGIERLKPAVVSFQKMMSLDTSGKLDSKTLTALNFTLQKRMKQMKESLNYWRWTGRLREREFILVNIPAARLQAINNDSAVDFGMRVIVGKTVTQTPTFTAYISKVIAYPYWTVPFSIATKEMLPKIKNDLYYLENNNLQVLDAKGTVLDPTTVNWNKFSTKHFPVTIRQGTGCDNSLGVLKFDLNSPFSVYLHDTNHRDLFSRKDRFMSHGCIRVEKPMELANYVLDNGLDSTTMAKLNQCLHDQKPESFPLKKKLPVLILYMTADVDPNGNLRFYRDVYDLEKLDEDEGVMVS